MNLQDKEPFNLIITGVGGQGNVLASRLVGEMLLEQGFSVSIGEIFGASQRGGPVMSQVRISAEISPSPRIPEGLAHMILSLEPVETLRALKEYGNPGVRVISNTRPVHPIGVICGEQNYPALEEIIPIVQGLTEKSWFVPATEQALELGSALLANMVLLGALAATTILPLERKSLEELLKRKMVRDKVEANLLAFDAGWALIHSDQG